MHHLDRDGAVEADVGGLVDAGHAAAGDPRRRCGSARPAGARSRGRRRPRRCPCGRAARGCTATLLRPGRGRIRGPHRTEAAPPPTPAAAPRRGAAAPRGPERRSGRRAAGLGAAARIAEHVGDVGPGLAVQAVLADRAEPLVVGADRVATRSRSRRRAPASSSTPAVALSCRRCRCRSRPAYSSIQRAGARAAPASRRSRRRSEARSICQPDSCQATARASCGSTPVRARRRAPCAVRWPCRAGRRGGRGVARWARGAAAALRGAGLAVGQRGDHDRDLEVLADAEPGAAAEVVVADQLGRPGVVADGEPGRGLAGPDRVVHDPAAAGQVAVGSERGDPSRTRVAARRPRPLRCAGSADGGREAAAAVEVVEEVTGGAIVEVMVDSLRRPARRPGPSGPVTARADGANEGIDRNPPAV